MLSSQYLELFSFAKDQHISVQSFISLTEMADMTQLFHLPLSAQAYAQFHQLTTILDDTVLQTGNDTWSYIWGSNSFASSKAYLSLTGTRQVHLAYKWLWKSNCEPKRKNSFSGSYLRIDSALVAFSKEEIWNWKVMIVYSVILTPKKP